MYTPTKERARRIKSVNSIWEDDIPVRIAIAALLNFGYSHLQTFEMMAGHYNLSEEEYWRNVKLYSLKESQ